MEATSGKRTSLGRPVGAHEPPYASCRICGKDIGRQECVAIWRRSGKLAHMACYDALWIEYELADEAEGVLS